MQAHAIATGGWESEAQAFADAMIDHRAGYWLAGDIAGRILKASVSEDARKKAQGQLASLAHCSIAYLRRLVQLADAFPEEHRYPDIAQPMYYACLRAAHRTKQPATRVLATALRNNWHVSRVSALGRENDAIRRMTGTCIACGGQLRFRRRGTAGLMIPCPGCLADARHERRALLDAFVVIGPLA